jgi:hypothetical protein
MGYSCFTHAAGFEIQHSSSSNIDHGEIPLTLALFHALLANSRHCINAPVSVRLEAIVEVKRIRRGGRSL